MICVGEDTSNMKLMQLGSDAFKAVYVGSVKVWPESQTPITDLNPNGKGPANDGTQDDGYMDMGPAGVWATCNIGASRPYEYGKYFAWAESQGYYESEIGRTANGKRAFYSTYYKWQGNKSHNLGAGDPLTDVTKYKFIDTDAGLADNKCVIEPEDDGAHIALGGDWRIPTASEFRKLVEYCNVQQTSVNGIAGYKFTLKTDSSKVLFFPMAGRAYGWSVKGKGSIFRYTASTNFDGDNGRYVLTGGDNFINSTNKVYWENRNDGVPIRPILAKPVNYSLDYSDLYYRLALIASGDGKVGFSNRNIDKTFAQKNVSKSNASCSIFAKANAGTDFIKWSDGNTNAERTLQLTGNKTLVAQFGFSLINVNLIAAGEDEGTVGFDSNCGYDNISKDVNANTDVQVYAKANSGYKFSYWTNPGGNANNPMTVKPVNLAGAETGIVNIAAVFEKDSSGGGEDEGKYTYSISISDQTTKSTDDFVCAIATENSWNKVIKQSPIIRLGVTLLEIKTDTLYNSLWVLVKGTQTNMVEYTFSKQINPVFIGNNNRYEEIIDIFDTN